MRVRAAMFLVVAAALALALMAEPAAAAPRPDLAGVLRLIGLEGIAHGCPIAADLALTNAHVVRGDGALVWANGAGADGLILTTRTYRYRDLATVTPEDGKLFPRWYPVAKDAPRSGERVYFIGYDFRSRKDAFAERVFESKVLRSIAGHLVMATPGVPGSSGSCVLNAQGEVVAINAGGKATAPDGGTKDPEWVGIAVEVWGAWQETGR